MNAGPSNKLPLALDLSEGASDLIRMTSCLVRALQPKDVVVATAIKIPTSTRADEFDGFPADKSERELKDSLARQSGQHHGEKAAEFGVKVINGNPAERIAEYAECSAFESMDIGSRDGALKRAILGSTSSAVVKSGKKSVLIPK